MGIIDGWMDGMGWVGWWGVVIYYKWHILFSLKHTLLGSWMSVSFGLGWLTCSFLAGIGMDWKVPFFA